mmetsp:Transcript_6626/g.20133  ORF Transcript_6626/g.20133 Transcript_6626/m.20133 type:complete len:91 (-) Transcript_6626:422-694(-)
MRAAGDGEVDGTRAVPVVDRRTTEGAFVMRDASEDFAGPGRSPLAAKIGEVGAVDRPFSLSGTAAVGEVGAVDKPMCLRATECVPVRPPG